MSTFVESLQRKAQGLSLCPLTDMIILGNGLHQHLIKDDPFLISRLPIYAGNCFVNAVVKTLATSDNAFPLYAMSTFQDTYDSTHGIFAGESNQRPTASILRYSLGNWIEPELNPFRLVGHMGSAYCPEFSDDCAEEAYDAKHEAEQALQVAALISKPIQEVVVQTFYQVSENLLRQFFAQETSSIKVSQFSSEYYYTMHYYIRAEFVG